MTQTDHNWKERYAGKIGAADEAVSIVKPGDKVWAGGWTSVPTELCAALAARAGELRDVTVGTYLTPFNWDQPAILDAFKIITFYAGPYERSAARSGRFDYIPVAQWREGQLPPGLDLGFDVAMIPISPPDEEGFCSFGGGVWFNPTITRSTAAKVFIGEVHPEFIRTAGENRVHVSKFDRLAEYSLTPSAPPIPPRSEETELAAQIICTLVASEIVYDGCTLQFGVGDVSAALPAFLGERHDLGVHTEIMPGGVVDLVKQGVVNSKYVPLHTGKFIASALVQMPPEELDYISTDERFELYDFTHTDDLRNLLQIENFVAVNNAMAVDLTGNAASETMGASIFSGTGGQAAFAVGASTAAGGSVIVLPSSQLVNGTRHSRILGGHPEGTVQTVHRSFVDFVVTEQGIARLRGKSIRERIGELISVSHPDFRAELKKDAQRLYGITV
jgi:acyl-CoA hydrolase